MVLSWGGEEESRCPHWGTRATRAGASGSSSPEHPPASTPAPCAAAGNTVPCYHQCPGTEPGLSRSRASPRGHLACRDPPPAPALLPGGRSHAPRWRAGSRSGAGGALPASGAGVPGIHNSMGGISPGCRRGQEPGQPSPPPGTHLVIFKSDWINLFEHRVLSPSTPGAEPPQRAPRRVAAGLPPPPSPVPAPGGAEGTGCPHQRGRGGRRGLPRLLSPSRCCRAACWVLDLVPPPPKTSLGGSEAAAGAR